VAVKLTKDAIDLGIVVKDGPAAVAFYRDVLGFKYQGEMPMPGGIGGATGYRYWTISVSNISELVAACAKAGRTVVVPEREFRPGIRIAIVEDPDGNWVEFLQGA
jgi:catechol 2,3-dioxygenase-like lactoylglutathione lyase family enzyme